MSGCSVLLVVVVLCVCSCGGLVSAAEDISQPDDSEDGPSAVEARHFLAKTIAALEKALGYFEGHIEKVNLDGVIGTRSIEGQLGSLLARYWTQLPMGTVTKLRELRARAGRFSDKCVKVVKKMTPHYYHKLDRMIAVNFWDVYYPSKPLRVELIRIPRRKFEGFDEKSSDDCLLGLIGNKENHKCNITQACWSRMIEQSRLSRYSLTHQVFYILNGVSANCLTNLTYMARVYSDLGSSPRPLRSLLDRFCANVYAEALYYEQAAFPVENRDLFMEQIDLCSVAGYSQMAQWRWLKPILQWQHSSGCYATFPGERIDQRNFDKTMYGKNRRRRSVQLHKRVESLMSSEDGCLAHRTSVALGALVGYVRRLVEFLAPASGL